jgi:hypothetical protein
MGLTRNQSPKTALDLARSLEVRQDSEIRELRSREHLIEAPAGLWSTPRTLSFGSLATRKYSSERKYEVW